MMKFTDTNKKIGAAVLSLSALTVVAEKYSNNLAGSDNPGIQSSSEIVTKARMEMEALTTTSHDIREEAFQLQDQYRDLRLRLERLKMVETALNAVIANGETSAATAKTEITGFTERIRNANRKIDLLGKEIDNIKIETENAIAEICEQKDKINKLNGECEELEKELAGRNAVHKKKDSFFKKVEKILRKPF